LALGFRQKALSALNREKNFEFRQDCRARAPEAASRSQLIRANHQIAKYSQSASLLLESDH
jgi:hypothetical protein